VFWKEQMLLTFQQLENEI